MQTGRPGWVVSVIGNFTSYRNACSLFCIESFQKEIGISLKKKFQNQTAASSFLVVISDVHNPHLSCISSDLPFPTLTWEDGHGKFQYCKITTWAFYYQHKHNKSFLFECLCWRLQLARVIKLTWWYDVIGISTGFWLGSIPVLASRAGQSPCRQVACLICCPPTVTVWIQTLAC